MKIKYLSLSVGMLLGFSVYGQTIQPTANDANPIVIYMGINKFTYNNQSFIPYLTPDQAGRNPNSNGWVISDATNPQVQGLVCTPNYSSQGKCCDISVDPTCNPNMIYGDYLTVGLMDTTKNEFTLPLNVYYQDSNENQKLIASLGFDVFGQWGEAKSNMPIGLYFYNYSCLLPGSGSNNCCVTIAPCKSNDYLVKFTNWPSYMIQLDTTGQCNYAYSSPQPPITLPTSPPACPSKSPPPN